MNVETLLERVRDPKPNGQARWMAFCPVPSHKDVRGRSLSIRYDSGRILLHCFAGCDVSELCSALGIQLRDLMPENSKIRREPDDAHRVPAGALLQFFTHEASVVAQLAAAMRSRGLKRHEWERLTAAHRRIGAACALVAPYRPNKPPTSHAQLDRIKNENPVPRTEGQSCPEGIHTNGETPCHCHPQAQDPAK